MINASFRYQNGAIAGFSIEGHAGAGFSGEDVVCAAVSSAAYMTANTLTDVCGVPADITVDDGVMHLSLTETHDHTARVVLEGFFLHMNALQEQYPKRIQVLKTEV